MAISCHTGADGGEASYGSRFTCSFWRQERSSPGEDICI